MGINNPLQILFLSIGLAFGLIAAGMAYLILYGEYIRHFMGDKKRPRQMALQGAIFTFVFFFALSLLAGYVLTAYIIGK